MKKKNEQKVLKLCVVVLYCECRLRWECGFIVCGERLSELATIQSTHHHKMNTVADAMLLWSVYIRCRNCLAVVEKRASLFQFPCVCVRVWRCGRIDSAYTHTVYSTAQYNKLMRIQAASLATRTHTLAHKCCESETVRWALDERRLHEWARWRLMCARNQFRSNDTQRHL